MNSEISTYQSHLGEYKTEIERLHRELIEVKKKFF